MTERTSRTGAGDVAGERGMGSGAKLKETEQKKATDTVLERAALICSGSGGEQIDQHIYIA